MFKEPPASNVVKMPDPTEARATHRRLHARAAELEKELSDINSVEYLASEEGRLDEMARQMLAGAAPTVSLKDAEQRRRELQAELSVTRRALALAKDDLAKVASSEAKRKAAELRPEHRRTVANIARLLCELSRELDRERALRAKIPYPASLPAGGYPNVGSLEDYQSPIRYWLRHVKSNGALIELPAAAE